MSTNPQNLHLVLIETAGNQRTVFQTNRLRENIGASELIYQVGTRFVLDAVGADPDIASNPEELQAFWLDPRRNAPIENNKTGIEIIIATSGKAMVLVEGCEKAREIVSHVTWLALDQAPGVTVRGAIVDFVWGEDEASAERLHKAVGTAHERLEKLRSQLPSPDLRFPRLPFVVDCRSSGLPAMRLHEDPNLRDPVSRVVAAKRRAGQPRPDRSNKGVWARMQNALPDIKFPSRIDRLEGWMAIIHADGNGLGQVFLNLLDYTKAKSARDHIDKLRRFSLAIDLCSRTAAKRAIEETWPDIKGEKPVIPIVLGGDDLTVVCDGTRAVKFAAAYLRAFEAASVEELEQPLGTIIKEILCRNGAEDGRLAGAAGIAIVKPHFPFHRAYAIAEALTASAKAVKKNVTTQSNGQDAVPYPCSALDFQVVLDSSGSDLAPIRARMRLDEKTALFARPYVVTPPDKNAPVDAHSRAWVANRLYGDEDEATDNSSATLRRAVRALRRRPAEVGQSVKKGEGHLPRGQAHVLLEALDRGPAAVDGAAGLIEQRYEKFDWQAFMSGGSLFFNDIDEEGKPWLRTRLLDAMELADLEAEGPARIVLEEAADEEEAAHDGDWRCFGSYIADIREHVGLSPYRYHGKRLAYWYWRWPQPGR